MATPEYVVTRGADAQVIAGGAITLLAEAPGALAFNRSLLPEGYAGVPPHYHERTTELFFLLGGRLDALAGDALVTLEVGDTLLVPAGTVHALAPGAGAEADFLAIAASAPERFAYYRLLDDVQRGAAGPEDIGASQERFDIRFADSPVWSAR